MNKKITRRKIIKIGGVGLLGSTFPFTGFSYIKLTPMITKKSFEVIIVGGSYAGLSAALALGRSLRDVLIIDSGLPCNRQTPHSHNFLTHDGEEPHMIAEKAKREVLAYKSVSLLEGLAVRAEKTDGRFSVYTKDGGVFDARKLVLATGIKDQVPDIKGFADCWGISIIHCPYCHGYEFKDMKTGIFANGDQAYHLTSLVDNLTDNLVILTNGPSNFSSEQMEKLAGHSINIIETPVAEISNHKGQIKSVVFADGATLDLDALYAALPFEQHSKLSAQLACELTEHGHIQVDLFQKTSVPGVFACGDNSTPFRAVSYAVASGTIVGSMINMELVQEEF